MVVAFCSRMFLPRVDAISLSPYSVLPAFYITRNNTMQRPFPEWRFRFISTAAQSFFQSLYLVSFFCMQIIRHLPTYVALRVLSLFSREIPLGNKIACNIIPDSPISPSASPFHLYQIPLRDVHLFFLFLSAWSAGCIFDAPSTDNVP